MFERRGNSALHFDLSSEIKNAITAFGVFTFVKPSDKTNSLLPSNLFCAAGSMYHSKFSQSINAQTKMSLAEAFRGKFG